MAKQISLQEFINEILLTIRSFGAEGVSDLHSLAANIREFTGVDPEVQLRHFQFRSFKAFLHSDVMRSHLDIREDANGNIIYLARYDPKLQHIVIEQTRSIRAREEKQDKERYYDRNAGTIGRRFYDGDHSLPKPQNNGNNAAAPNAARARDAAGGGEYDRDFADMSRINGHINNAPGGGTFRNVNTIANGDLPRRYNSSYDSYADERRNRGHPPDTPYQAHPGEHAESMGLGARSRASRDHLAGGASPAQFNHNYGNGAARRCDDLSSSSRELATRQPPGAVGGGDGQGAPTSGGFFERARGIGGGGAPSSSFSNHASADDQLAGRMWNLATPATMPRSPPPSAKNDVARGRVDSDRSQQRDLTRESAIDTLTNGAFPTSKPSAAQMNKLVESLNNPSAKPTVLRLPKTAVKQIDWELDENEAEPQKRDLNSTGKTAAIAIGGGGGGAQSIASYQQPSNKTPAATTTKPAKRGTRYGNEDSSDDEKKDEAGEATPKAAGSKTDVVVKPKRTQWTARSKDGDYTDEDESNDDEKNDVNTAANRNNTTPTSVVELPASSGTLKRPSTPLSSSSSSDTSVSAAQNPTAKPISSLKDVENKKLSFQPFKPKIESAAVSSSTTVATSKRSLASHGEKWLLELQRQDKKKPTGQREMSAASSSPLSSPEKENALRSRPVVQQQQPSSSVALSAQPTAGLTRPVALKQTDSADRSLNCSTLSGRSSVDMISSGETTLRRSGSTLSMISSMSTRRWNRPLSEGDLKKLAILVSAAVQYHYPRTLFANSFLAEPKRTAM